MTSFVNDKNGIREIESKDYVFTLFRDDYYGNREFVKAYKYKDKEKNRSFVLIEKLDFKVEGYEDLVREVFTALRGSFEGLEVISVN